MGPQLTDLDPVTYLALVRHLAARDVPKAIGFHLLRLLGAPFIVAAIVSFAGLIESGNWCFGVLGIFLLVLGVGLWGLAEWLRSKAIAKACITLRMIESMESAYPLHEREAFQALKDYYQNREIAQPKGP